jgi:uncharacterized protein DUF5329
MNRKLTRFVYLSAFATFFLPFMASAATDDMLVRTINHLLAYVEASNCVFIRNGKEHNSQEAAKHMKTKYDYFMFNIKTPEEFIEKAGSKSIIGGQPYWVRCADHSPILSAEWLTQELSNYRSISRSDR